MNDWITVEYQKVAIEEYETNREQKTLFNLYQKIDGEKVVVAVGSFAVVSMTYMEWMGMLKKRNVLNGFALMERCEGGCREIDEELNQFFWVDIKKINEKFVEITGRCRPVFYFI